MLFDAHTHMMEHTEAILANKDILFIANASNAKEYKFYKDKQAKHENLHISCGIHPCHADTTDFQETFECLKEARYIGEIGLDGIWCDVDMKIQEQAFISQLEYAEMAKKPVILHTKACEKQIAEIISKYTMPVLVHWYSDENYLEEYMERGCYFTIGPSVGVDPNVTKTAALVPLEKIMVETDGLSAVEWALNKKYLPEEIGQILENSINTIASIRHIDSNELKKIVFNNAIDFFRL